MGARIRAALHGSRLLRASAAASAAAAAAAAWHASPSSAESSAQKSKQLIKYISDHEQTPQPGLELLVHNISHADLVVSLKEGRIDGKTPPDMSLRTFLARPQFNSFMPVTNAIERDLEQLESLGRKPGVINCLSKYRVQYPTGLSLLQSDGESDGVAILPQRPSIEQSAAGDADAASPPLPLSAAWKQFHVKQADAQTPMGRELASIGQTAPRVVAVYLPLLAVVLPEWIRSIKRRALQLPGGTPPPRKVLVLVSGAGQPRDEKANPADNSTEGVGHIIERFVKLVHPDIEVYHSASPAALHPPALWVSHSVLPYACLPCHACSSASRALPQSRRPTASSVMTITSVSSRRGVRQLTSRSETPLGPPFASPATPSLLPLAFPAHPEASLDRTRTRRSAAGHRGATHRGGRGAP